MGFNSAKDDDTYKKEKKMKGYKVFNPDWTCRHFQYEVGQEYSIDESPECCKRGFHFCEKASDCFQYYSFDPDNKVAEVEALGEIDMDGVKLCTNKIKIVREIPWVELMDIMNEGKNCIGFYNLGDFNTGNYNVGNQNTGNYNTGKCNAGDFNTGSCNIGDCNAGNGNTGDYNAGNGNTGNRNTGAYNKGNRNTGNYNAENWNTGNYNIGHYNVGDYNVGNWNTGDYNIGKCNTGDFNIGNRNTGSYNVGNYNTGDWNTGNRNTGDWNVTSFSSGVFNIEEANILMFNKPSDWTYRDWLDSAAKRLLNQIPKNIVEWIWSDDMTDEEKAEHPTYETTKGYLKILDESECCQIWWDDLSDEQKEIIRSIPNYDKEIFEQITGIKTE